MFAAHSETSNDDAPKSSPEQRLAFARQSAEAYRFRIKDHDKLEVKLHPEPLLRWNNKVIREDDGLLFIWTEGDKGRPLATAQFFVVDTNWHHEFQSLSVNGFDAQFQGEGGANWAWRPNRPGLEYVLATDVNPPAASANLRLRQMKTIAGQFTAAVDPEETFASPDQLRLLTTPVYRYSSDADGILDGAVFAEPRDGIDVGNVRGHTAVTYASADGTIREDSLVCFFTYPYDARPPTPWSHSHRDDD
jgi:hypothetical protein